MDAGNRRNRHLPHFALSNNVLQAWLKEWYKTGVIRSYLPAIVFLILGGAIGGLFGSLNLVTGRRNRRREVSKHDPYECGLPSEIQRGFRFGISFYMIAMLFILFDIEVIFIYPIAVQLRAFGTFALVETITFVVLLMIAFGYVWRRGALEWK
jgi:NADH-quinone oxidoreductase subunit A